MLEQSNEIITLLLGGGAVGIVTVVMKAIKEWREGRTVREDTAIKRWKELATEHEAAADKAWSITASYRRWYPRLWAAYVGATGDRDTYPSDPTDESAPVSRGEG